MDQSAADALADQRNCSVHGVETTGIDLAYFLIVLFTLRFATDSKTVARTTREENGNVSCGIMAIEDKRRFLQPPTNNLFVINCR